MTKVRCIGGPKSAPCGWEGDVEAARTGNIHVEQAERMDGSPFEVTVEEFRCPRCGGKVAMPA